MITRSYDAVVVHPSPGAFTAAALLAAKGHQVLVVERPDEPAPTGRYRFPNHRRPVAGIAEGPWLPQALREIQVHPQDVRALRRSEPLYQVVTPEHRLDVLPEGERMVAELRREFGPARAVAANNLLARLEEATDRYMEAIAAALGEQTQGSFWSRIGVRKMSFAEPPEPAETDVTLFEAAEQEGVPEPLMHALGAPMALLSSIPDPYRELGLGRAGLLLMGALDGLYQDPEIPDAFQGMMRRRVEGLKVDITRDDQPEELVIGWGRLKEIRFAGRKQPVRAESLITGEDPAELAGWLKESLADQYSAAGLDLVPTHVMHSLRLGITDDVVPVGMCDHVFLLDDEVTLEGPGCLLISLTPRGSKAAPPKRRAMTVSCRLPREILEDAHQLELASKAMLARVKELMPYLERYIEVVHIPQRGPRTDANPFPIDPRPVTFAAAGDRHSAGLTLPHRNLFYCGRGALPSLGLEGEVLAGMAVARLASQVIRKGK